LIYETVCAILQRSIINNKRLITNFILCEEVKMKRKYYAPSVILASGTMGFFGEGYPYHKLIYPFMWIVKHSSMFVAKIVTVDGAVGNMLPKDDSSPQLFGLLVLFCSWTTVLLTIPIAKMLF